MDQREEIERVNRREFLCTAGAAAILFSLGGCITHVKTTPPPMAGDLIIFPFSNYPQLRQVGGVAVAGPVRIGRYKGNLYVRRQSEDGAIALGAVCRHLGCDVNWEEEENEFVCPCHGSRYAADGALREGPARKGLRAWKARVQGERITISMKEPPLRT